MQSSLYPATTHRRTGRRLLRKRLLVLAGMFAGALVAFAATAPFLDRADVATARLGLIAVGLVQVAVFFMYRNSLLRHHTSRSMMRAFVLSLIGTLVFELLLLTILSGGLLIPGQ